ncbi:MAG: NAD-dependent epimerase/dehydratase family protein [Proteobacteria bacterium]|nr:NAD-dependent epimerase/dehydratase family protein [Pseudomonadota bacterium]
MHYLLTGATGYIGSKLAVALAGLGYDVHAIVRPSSDLAVLDARVQAHTYSGEAGRIHEIIGQIKPDVVVHLAAEVERAEKSISLQNVRESNIEFGCRILEAMAANNITSFVNVGSYWEYGPDGEFKPNTYYAATKRAFQNIVTYYADNFDLGAITLVLYDVYGAYDWRGKFLTNILEMAKTGTIVQATPGDQIIGPIHIDDVVSGFVSAGRRVLNRDELFGHQVCFLNPLAFVSLKELIGLVNKVLATPIEVDWGRFPYGRSQIMIPYRGGAPLPGWHPNISLSKGLLELLNQYGLRISQA